MKALGSRLVWSSDWEVESSTTVNRFWLPRTAAPMTDMMSAAGGEPGLSGLIGPESEEEPEELLAWWLLRCL